MAGEDLSDAVYSRLLALRSGLRHFQRWSEVQVRAAGLAPAQHQLLLAVRGHSDRRGPTVGDVADPPRRGPAAGARRQMMDRATPSWPHRWRLSPGTAT